MASVESMKAANAAWGYTFPKEVAFPGKAPETCKEASVFNKMKCEMYIPVYKSIGCGEMLKMLQKSRDEKNKKELSPMDKALITRAIISEALGSILGGLVLLIADIFFTIFVKPFLNLAVHLQNKKEENEANETKAIEEQKKATPAPTTPAEPVKEAEKVEEKKEAEKAEEKTTQPPQEPNDPNTATSDPSSTTTK